jgi:hypothetical protein
MYRFVKNYSVNGTTYYAGVSFKGIYSSDNDCVSGVLLKNIPLDYVEEYELAKLAKKKRAKKQKEKIESKSGTDSSRVSDSKI